MLSRLVSLRLQMVLSHQVAARALVVRKPALLEGLVLSRATTFSIPSTGCWTGSSTSTTATHLFKKWEPRKLLTPQSAMPRVKKTDCTTSKDATA